MVVHDLSRHHVGSKPQVVGQIPQVARAGQGGMTVVAVEEILPRWKAATGLAKGGFLSEPSLIELRQDLVPALERRPSLAHELPYRLACVLPRQEQPALATGLKPLPRVEHSCLHVVAKVAANHVDTVGPLQFPLPSSHLDPWDPCETGSIGYVDFMLPDIERNGGWTSSAEGDVRIV